MKYHKSPIFERALSIHAPLSEEVYQLGAEDWASKVKPEFPDAEVVTEWLLSLGAKNGMPILEQETHQMTIRQTFWVKKDGKKQRGMQLWGDKVAFNLIGSPPNNSRHFEELEAMVETWLPRWIEHFRASTFHGVSLEYVNLLSKETLPEFVDDKTFKAAEVLHPFRYIPGPHKSLITPFDFQMNVRVPDPALNLRFTARCHTIAGTPLAMHLRFTATTHDETKVYTLDQIRDQIKVVHELILTEFEVYFTEGAKMTFAPYAPDNV